MADILKQAQAYADSIIKNANTYEQIAQRNMLIQAYIAGSNNMTNKLVYVVVEDSVYDYESYTHVQVFDTMEKAEACVADLKKCNEDDCINDGWVLVTDDKGEFCYQEDGDYTRNHYLVSIWTQEVG